jgi:hypothetical protein
MKIAGTKTFDVYADPGHAWMKVSLKDIQSYGLAEKISSYSYMRGGFAYLEEDSDLTKLRLAFGQVGRTVKFREHHGDKRSKIRGYASYNPDKVDWNKCEVMA